MLLTAIQFIFKLIDINHFFISTFLLITKQVHASFLFLIFLGQYCQIWLRKIQADFEEFKFSSGISYFPAFFVSLPFAFHLLTNFVIFTYFYCHSANIFDNF